MTDLSIQEDNNIVKGIIDNEQWAYKQFVKKYHKLILFLCNKTCRNIQDADELCNDIMLKIFGKIRLYDHKKARLTAWVNTVTCNYLKDSIIDDQSINEKSLEQILESESYIYKYNNSYDFRGSYENCNITDISGNDNDLECLRKAMKKISERDKLILYYKADGFDYNEIAQFLNVNYKTATTAYSRAVNKIKAEFAKKTIIDIKEI